MAILNNKQYDSRWASLPYAGQTYAAAGCGPTSASDLTGNYPTETGTWLTQHGYASNGSGTYWEGIPEVLQAFNVSAAQLNYSSLYGNTTSAVFTQFQNHIKSGYCGILLMGPGVFTSGGHFIAIVGYSGGKYRVYDPASASRDGYHAWSDFAGCIKVCYTSGVKWESAPAPETWQATGTATCTDNGVRVRETPSLTGTILGQLNTGMRFEIDGKTSGDWTHVNVAGIGIGWMYTQYVKKDTPVVTPTYKGYRFSPMGLQYGSRGASVTLFERILKARNIYTGSIDTTYGDGCVKACEKQQALRGLVQDGLCGSQTWHSMIGVPYVVDVYYAQPCQFGSTGASVRLAEEILYTMGYYSGAIDGSFGNGMRQAVLTVQKVYGLVQDGSIGDATWKVLIGF